MTPHKLTALIGLRVVLVCRSDEDRVGRQPPHASHDFGHGRLSGHWSGSSKLASSFETEGPACVIAGPGVPIAGVCRYRLDVAPCAVNRVVVVDAVRADGRLQTRHGIDAEQGGVADIALPAHARRFAYLRAGR